MSANLTPLIRTMVVALGGQLQAILPEAACHLTIKVGLPGSLVAEGAFSASAVALLVRDSGLLQIIAPASAGKSAGKGAN